MSKLPKIKDVNHFYLRKGVLMSGYRIFSLRDHVLNTLTT